MQGDATFLARRDGSIIAAHSMQAKAVTHVGGLTFAHFPHTSLH